MDGLLETLNEILLIFLSIFFCVSAISTIDAIKFRNMFKYGNVTAYIVVCIRKYVKTRNGSKKIVVVVNFVNQMSNRKKIVDQTNISKY